MHFGLTPWAEYKREKIAKKKLPTVSEFICLTEVFETCKNLNSSGNPPYSMSPGYSPLVDSLLHLPIWGLWCAGQRTKSDGSAFIVDSSDLRLGECVVVDAHVVDLAGEIDCIIRSSPNIHIIG